MNRIFANVTAVFLVLALASVSVGQPTEAPAKIGMNVDFKGGTAAEYVRSVRQAASDVNVVVLADLDQVKMPPVQLRGVDAGSALRILESLQPDADQSLVQIRVKEDQGPIAAFSRVYTVIGAVRAQKAAERHSFVINVSDLLSDKLKPADLLTAIEAALELTTEQGQPAQVRFHEATGLLITRGRMDQIATIETVITQLRERSVSESEREALRQANTRLESQTTQAMQKLDLAQQRLEEMMQTATKLGTRNELLMQELAMTRTKLEDAESRLRHMSLFANPQQDQPRPREGRP